MRSAPFLPGLQHKEYEMQKLRLGSVMVWLMLFGIGCATVPPAPPPVPLPPPVVKLKDTNVGFMVRFTLDGEIISRDTQTHTAYSPRDALNRVGESMLKRGYRLKALDDYRIRHPGTGDMIDYYNWPGDVGEARRRIFAALEHGGFQDGGIVTLVLGEVNVISGTFDAQAGVHTGKARTNLEIINVYTRNTFPTHQSVGGQGLDLVASQYSSHVARLGQCRGNDYRLPRSISTALRVPCEPAGLWHQYRHRLSDSSSPTRAWRTDRPGRFFAAGKGHDQGL